MIAARKGTIVRNHHQGKQHHQIIGAHMMIYPGAFNLTTGPLHWELLQRGRYVNVSPCVEKSGCNL